MVLHSFLFHICKLCIAMIIHVKSGEIFPRSLLYAFEFTNVLSAKLFTMVRDPSFTFLFLCNLREKQRWIYAIPNCTNEKLTQTA